MDILNRKITEEEFIQICKDCIDNMKKSHLYTNFYHGSEGISFEVNSRALLPVNLFEDFEFMGIDQLTGAKFNLGIDGKQEVFQLMIEQWCGEAITMIIRYASENKEIPTKTINLQELEKTITEAEYDTVMLSAELYTQISDLENLKVNPVHPYNFFPLGIERHATLNDKSIMLNPMLPSKIFLLYNFGKMEFNIRMDDYQSNEFTDKAMSFILECKYDPTIMMYYVVDFDPYFDEIDYTINS